jgi:hypothetical protein
MNLAKKEKRNLIRKKKKQELEEYQRSLYQDITDNCEHNRYLESVRDYFEPIISRSEKEKSEQIHALNNLLTYLNSISNPKTMKNDVRMIKDHIKHLTKL